MTTNPQACNLSMHVRTHDVSPCPLALSGGTAVPQQTGQPHLRYQPSLCLALQSPKPQGKRRVTHCKGRQSFQPTALCTRLLPQPRDCVHTGSGLHAWRVCDLSSIGAPLNIHLDGLQRAAVIWIATHQWLIVGALEGSEESSEAAP